MIAAFEILIFLALLLSGCNYSIQKLTPQAVPPPSQYKTSELSFASVYSRVLRTNCISCHGSSGNVNLESYANTKSKIEKIYQSAILDKKMPKAPGNPLSSDQLGLLNAWIQAGAPEAATGGGDPIPPLEAKFESIKLHILEPKCLMCHSPSQPVSRIPLVTLGDLLNSPLDLVLPGNAEESGIILAITNERPDKLMPPAEGSDGKPTGFSKLSDEEIKIFTDWINSGAKD